MSAETLNEIRSSNSRARAQMSDDAITWADVETELRDAEEKIALLLKHTENCSKMDELFMALETARGIAGGMALKDQ